MTVASFTYTNLDGVRSRRIVQVEEMDVATLYGIDLVKTQEEGIDQYRQFHRNRIEDYKELPVEQEVNDMPEYQVYFKCKKSFADMVDELRARIDSMNAEELAEEYDKAFNTVTGQLNPVLGEYDVWECMTMPHVEYQFDEFNICWLTYVNDSGDTLYTMITSDDTGTPVFVANYYEYTWEEFFDVIDAHMG